MAQCRQQLQDISSRLERHRSTMTMTMTMTRFIAILLIILVATVATAAAAAAADSQGERDESQKSKSARSTSEQECVLDNEGQCKNVDMEINRDDDDAVDAVGDDDDDDDNDDDDDDDDDDGYDDNDVWKIGTISEITDHLECEWESKEVHQQDAWTTFNRIYNEAVGLEKSSIPPKYDLSGFQIPIEIKYSEDVGRGVFTKVDIKKGDLIYISTNNAQFQTAQEYRNFLKQLPQDLACDVIIWAFSRMVSAEKEEEFIACVDLDEGSFVNSAHHSKLECNMELGTKDGLLKEDDDERVTWYGCDLKFFAIRDIKADEEIRADYGDFAEPHGWLAMGLNSRQ
jgi:hypothetical protein